MYFYLMHKDVKVLKMDIDNDGMILKIIDIYDSNHMPFSTNIHLSKHDYTLFKKWWSDRSIPLSRKEYNNVIENLDDTSLSLVVKAHGLSLNDQYWIKEINEDYNYDDLSFFSNRFSEDLGDVLIGKKQGDTINYYSPDSTSTGDLKKRWKIVDGKRFLYKAGSKPYEYEIFNEIIASKIMSLLGIEHVEYEFVKDRNDIFCSSLDFISYNEDFVSAYQLLNYRKKGNDTSLYEHLIDVCDSLGIRDFKTKVDQMLFIDYLLGNEDRHLNNFGVIRDAKTLEFIRIAPVYDTGSCLGFNKTDQQLESMIENDWKPFKTKKITNQLELISDFNWLDFDALKEVPGIADKTMNLYSDYLSIHRRRAIISFITRRINDFFKFMNVEKSVNYAQKNDFTLLEKRLYDMFIEKKVIYSLDEFIDKQNISYITAYRTISSLTDKGIIKRVGSRKNGYWEMNE